MEGSRPPTHRREPRAAASVASGVLVLSLLGIGCGGGSTGGAGGDGGTGTTSSSSDSSTNSSTNSSTSSSSTSSSTTSSTTTSSTTSEGCIEITAGAFTCAQSSGTLAAYYSDPAPNLGGPDLPDTLWLELYGDEGFNGGATGTFDLAMDGDGNYATCSRCTRVFEDEGDNGPARQYFQSSGTLTVDAGSDPLNAVISATWTDVTLVEVTLDPITFESTPVPGGACLHIAGASIEVGPPPD